MSNTTLITITSLNLVVSSVTLGGLIYAAIKGRKVKKDLEIKIEGEIDTVKAQTKSTINKLKNALDAIDI